jgi:hypothetical protein
MNRKQRGFGLIEYILGTVLLASILFVPVNGKTSLSVLLIEAVKKEHAAYIHMSSLSNIDAVINLSKKKKSK